jgi:hypothetical protein
MANLAHNIGDMLAKLAIKLGRKLTAKEVLTLDKKVVSSLLSQKTTAEEAAKLLGKKKLSATEVKGFLKPAVSPAAKVTPKTKRTPTPKSVRAKKSGGRSKGELEALYRKKLSVFQRLNDNVNTDPDKLFAEAEYLKKTFGKTEKELLSDMQEYGKSGETFGLFQYTSTKDASKVRQSAINSGMSRDNAGRLIIEEGKYENEALNMGTKAGDPAKTRSIRVGITLTPQEKAAMGTVRFSPDELKGKVTETGAGAGKYWVFAKTADEAVADMNKFMSSLHANMAKGTKRATKGTKNVSESPQTTALVKREATETEAPVQTVKGNRVLTPQTTALAKRGETRMEAPVQTVKGDRVLTPQTTALTRRGGRVEAPSKTGTGRKLATGAAVAAGLGIAASRNGQQGDRTQVEPLNKKTSVGSTESPENAAASGEIDAEAATPSVTIPEAQFKKDVVDYVHTKGGDYPIFRRNSDSAMTWRNTYATAKKNGESTFTFNGLKYKV